VAATSPFKTTGFRIVFSVLALGWLLFHLFLLRWFGFNWALSVWDSVISNFLLMGIAFVMTIILQFYIPNRNRYSYLFALCVILTLTWFFTSRAIILLVLNQQQAYIHFFAVSLPIRMAFGFLIISCMALLCVSWYTILEQQETEKRKSEADKLAKEAELFQLRQQLQPHFLFNSLNSINALISIRPQQARTMIQQLSDFLRGTLRKEDDQWVTLNEELNQLNLYLEIEKVRFGHRLTTEIINEADGDKMKLPALLLQPVLENAIKFGLYDTIDTIKITLETKSVDNMLLVRIANPFDPETSTPRKGTGFGLNSVYRRLYLLFARTDLMKTETSERLFITTNQIPQI
jgi:two-component system LytT family sensor kinase